MNDVIINSDWVILPEKSTVGLDDISDRRSPSQKAIDASRNLSKLSATTGGLNALGKQLDRRYPLKFLRVLLPTLDELG